LHGKASRSSSAAKLICFIKYKNIVPKTRQFFCGTRIFHRQCGGKVRVSGKTAVSNFANQGHFRLGQERARFPGRRFYNYSHSTREAPVVLLNLKYNFNNDKSERNANRETPDDEEL
jgi:hypothetical protein